MYRKKRSGFRTSLKLFACLAGVVYVAPHPANSMSSLPLDLGRAFNVGKLLSQTSETMLVKALQEIRVVAVFAQRIGQ